MGSVICLVFILLWVQTGDQFQTEMCLQPRTSLSPGDGSHSAALIQPDGVCVWGGHDGHTETQPGGTINCVVHGAVGTREDPSATSVGGTGRSWVEVQ